MGVTMYAATLARGDESVLWCRIGKTAGWEGDGLARLAAFVSQHQDVVVFREDSPPLLTWRRDGFFDESVGQEVDPLEGIEELVPYYREDCLVAERAFALRAKKEGS